MYTKKFIYACICYALFLLICVHYVQVDISTEQYMSVWARMFYISCMCILLYVGSYILVKDSRSKVRKLWFYMTFLIMFILYVITVLQLTLFDPVLGRSTDIAVNFMNIKEYILETANFEPLYMIRLYWNGYQNELITLEQFIMNMAGNTVIMMPMGFFLPILNKEYAKFGKFVVTVLVMILMIEVAQALSMRGYFDVDDILLNLAGACIMFIVLKLPILRDFIKWLKGEK